MDVPGWLAIAMGIGGIFGGTFGAWLLQVYKERNATSLATKKQSSELKTTEQTVRTELELKESEQAFKMYKEIVDAMKRDMTDLKSHMNASDKAHLDCKEENAMLKADLRVLRAELETVRYSVGMKPSGLLLEIDKKEKSNELPKLSCDITNLAVKP